MELFKLFGTIAINSDGANETIDKVVQKAEGAGSSFAAMGGKLFSHRGHFVPCI